jgi:hypothetical protein
MLFAALHGQKLTCAYLHAAGCDWDAVAAYAAAKTGHWDTFRWLYEHGCPCFFEQTCLKAAEQGSIENMTYML